MKKTYISPELEVVRIETARMLAASGDQKFTISNGTKYSGWADSRENDLDFDE